MHWAPTRLSLMCVLVVLCSAPRPSPVWAKPGPPRAKTPAAPPAHPTSPARNEAATQSASPTQPAPPTQPASPTEGVTDREILIGMSAAFKGASRSLGIELYRGSMAYFTE